MGVPGPDVEDENVVLAVIALALFEQEHLPDHAEVGELLHHAELAPGLTADPSGFARDFFGRLRTIHDAGLDYWFYGA
jgi:hypothetical protein